LIAAFLLINPLLEWVFRKFEIQAEKLQFWVMLSTGTAWVIGLVYQFLVPESIISDSLAGATELLPNLAFSQDRISGALVLAAVGFVFIIVLTRDGKPQFNAWLAGLGGACVIGLQSNSAYTLGLTWTIIEGFHFYFSYRDRQIASNPRKYLPVVFTRLSAPAALILFSVIQDDPESAGVLSLLPGSGMMLIIIGLIGFLGWFLSLQEFEEDQLGSIPGRSENWMPALLGILLILRGAGAVETGSILLFPSLALSIALLIIVLAGVLFDKVPEVWFLTCGLFVSAAAFSSGTTSALSWCLVMILPGVQMWSRGLLPKSAIIPLILSTLGLLPLPFLPAWPGVMAFSAGVPGIILGLSYGILLGSVLIRVLKNWGSTGQDSGSFDLLGVIGAAAILISQLVISIKLDLINLSKDIFSGPITIWISLLGLIPVLILGNQLPLKMPQGFISTTSKIKEKGGKLFPGFLHFMDRMVGLISRILEGQAGLIWAFIIGLLLITMISIRGV
jgi:hypothetical protein